MADCHDQFKAFNDLITLTDTRKESLKASRTKLRERVRDYFKENYKDDIQPKFSPQGSSEMKTTINPNVIKKVDENGVEKSITKYDTDDGIYFIGDVSDRKTVQAYHNMVKKAVDGHTSIPPVDKNTCIRTVFADGHHIDQPIYFMDANDDSHPKLAHKADGWVSSDPLEFTKWFNDQVKDKEQLRRMVKYLKAWCDYINVSDNSKKMPSGFVLSIWASDNYVSDTRDDLAMKKLLQNLHSSLTSSFECIRPTTPKGTDIVESYDYETYFMEKLTLFKDSAIEAINETNPKNACHKWQKYFGPRFSCSTAKDEDEQAKSFSSAAVISSNAKSAKSLE